MPPRLDNAAEEVLLATARKTSKSFAGPLPTTCPFLSTREHRSYVPVL